MQGTEPHLNLPLSELLRRLADQHAAGRTLNVADLQQADPELLPELARELASFSVDTLRPRDTLSIPLQLDTRPPERPPVRDSYFPDIPGYEVQKLLGRGGMGKVFLARHRTLGRPVAIKMVLTAGPADADELVRFRAEAEAVAKLQHPNVVQIFEIGEVDGQPWFALEYVEGGSLDAQLQGKPQPPTEAAALVETLARAMQVCHDHGIIHRDLKPANILLASPGRESGVLLPKIADFGLARQQQDSGLTKTGAIMGTPSYMAPEQASARLKEIGPASDQYALGAILYQLLTGRPPFLGSNSYETVTLVLSTEATPPRRLVPAIPLDLETICLKALQKEPSKRYPNCVALADDMRRFLNHEPIAARPISAWERAWRWRKRNPLAAGLLAATALILLAGIAISTTFAVLANDRANTITTINQNLVTANQDAKAKAKFAEERSLLAVKTLENVIVEIQSELKNVPNAQKVRGRLLKKALAGLQELQTELDNKQRVDRGTALATLALAAVFIEVGNDAGFAGPATAQKLYDNALERLEVLAAAEPDSIQAKLDLAGACVAAAINLEKIDESGMEVTPEKSAEQSQRPLLQRAKALHRRSIELRRQVRLAVPSQPRHAFELGEACKEASYLEMRAGTAENARQFLAEAQTVAQQLVAEHPKEADFVALLGKSHELIGDWHYDLKNEFVEAESCYREAIRIFERNVAAHPDDPRGQMELANAWSRLADVHQVRAGRAEKAGDTATAQRERQLEFAATMKEFAITEKLAAAAPDNAKYQWDHTLSYDHLGRWYFFQKKYAEGIEPLRKNFDIRLPLLDADPANRHHHTQFVRNLQRLGVCYEQTGQLKQALEVYAAGLARLSRFKELTGDASMDEPMAGFGGRMRKLLPRPPAR